MEARQLKQREYNTDVFSHPNENQHNYDAKVRYNNNTRSNVMHTEPDQTQEAKLQNRKGMPIVDRPLHETKTRTSYQDSNPINNQGNEYGTIQKSAQDEKLAPNMRGSNTFHSSVFGDATQFDGKERVQNTFKSRIFGTPIVENPGRQRLGGESSGTSNLFGDDRVNYNQTSQNMSVRAYANTTTEATYSNNAPVNTAAMAKARELYGDSVDKHGVNMNKRDGALMSSNADWKNTQIDSSNMASPTKKKNMENGADRKDRKYGELSSDVFGTGEHKDFDRNAPKNKFGSDANWAAQGGTKHPVNVGSTKVDTFRQRQNQLASQVFGDAQTDYRGHEPMNKKPIDMDNWGHTNTAAPKGRKCDNDFKHTTSGQEPMKKDYTGYTAKGAKSQLLGSSLDRPIEYAPKYEDPTPQEEPQTFHIEGRETKATKQMFLASNDPMTGKSTTAGYTQLDQAKPEVIDWCVSGLPPSCEIRDLKKVSQAKHVISAVVDENNFTGCCTGTGRIKIRLNHGESADDVRLNFLRKGYTVRDFEVQANKTPALTGPPKEFAKEVGNTRAHKQGFLATSEPEAFGNSGFYAVKQ